MRRQIDGPGLTMHKNAYIGLGIVIAVLLVLPFVLPNSYKLPCFNFFFFMRLRMAER